MILTKKLKEHGQALELESVTIVQNAIGRDTE